jgi:hypothetical protein
MRILLVALCLLSLHPLAKDADADEPAKQTVLKISKETTHITEPLDSRGFVDYLAAIQQRASSGVTAENNFEVVVRKVIGPGEILEQWREEYHRRLGIPVPQDGFYVSCFDFHKTADRQSLLDEYHDTLAGPWQPEDAPNVTTWLKASSGHLDALVEGSKRTRNYTPYLAEAPSDDNEFPRLITVLLPSIQGYREIARALCIRANQRIAAGELDLAWDDIQAVYRISRLAGTGITVVEGLVGIATDSLACEAAEHVLRSPDLSDAQARRFLVDLKRLPPVATMAEKIDVGERYMGLDALQTITRKGNLLGALKLLKDLSFNDHPPKHFKDDNGTMLVLFQDEDETAAKQQNKQPNQIGPLINWNAAAILLNAWYDRLVNAAGEQSYLKRQKLFEELDRDIKKLQSGNLTLKILTIKSGDDVGRMIGETMVGLLLPALNAATAAQCSADVRLDILRIAFAAELYGRDYGRYPSELAKLTPQYLAEIPVDRFSDKQLGFGASARSFLIYSVGRNGKDDRGRGAEDARHADRGEQWDDIAIRLELN